MLDRIFINTYNRRNDEALSPKWKKIDKLKIRNLAPAKFVKCFYISLAIGMGIFLLALILFLIPPKSEDKDRQNKLEEVISEWSYTRSSELFKSSQFSYTFDDKSLGLPRFFLARTEIYKYWIDGYYPTYDETFHIYDKVSNVRHPAKKIIKICG